MGAGCSRHDSVVLGAIMQDVNAYDQSLDVSNTSSSRQSACKAEKCMTTSDCIPDVERRSAGQDQVSSSVIPATNTAMCTHSPQYSSDDHGMPASSEHNFILYPNHHHLETVPEDDTIHPISEGGIAAQDSSIALQGAQQPSTELLTAGNTLPGDVAGNNAAIDSLCQRQAPIEALQQQPSITAIATSMQTQGNGQNLNDGSGSCRTSTAAAEALLPFLAEPVQLRSYDEVFVAKAIAAAKKLPPQASSLVSKSADSLPPLPKQSEAVRNATCAPSTKLGKDQVTKTRKPQAGVPQVASRKKPSSSKPRSTAAATAANAPHSPAPLLSRLSYNSLMSDACESISGEVLGFSPPCYPAPDPSKQVPLEDAVTIQRAARRSSPSLRQGLPEECSYHSSVASELGEALDLSELSASLPPSQFGTRQATRQPSYVFDCKDLKSHGYHVHEGVDPLLAAEAMEKLAHQQMLHPEVSQTSVASTGSSVIGLKASLVVQQQHRQQALPVSSTAHHPPGQRGTVRRKKASQHGRQISHGRSASAIAGPPAVANHSRHSRTGSCSDLPSPGGMSGMHGAYYALHSHREDDEGELDEPPTTGPAVTQHACYTTPAAHLPDAAMDILQPCNSIHVAAGNDHAVQEQIKNEPVVEQNDLGASTQISEQIQAGVGVANSCEQLVQQQVDDVVEGLLSDIAGQQFSSQNQQESSAFTTNVWAADVHDDQYPTQDSTGQPCAESVETHHQLTSSGPDGSTVLQASVRLEHQWSGNRLGSSCSTMAYQHSEQQLIPSGIHDTTRDQLLNTTMAFCDHKDACTHMSLEELLPTRCFLKSGNESVSSAFPPSTTFYNTTALSNMQQQPCLWDTIQSTENLVPAEEDSSWLIALLPPSRLTSDGTINKDSSSSSLTACGTASQSQLSDTALAG